MNFILPIGIFLLAYPAVAQSRTSVPLVKAIMTVDATRVLKTIDRRLAGVNMEWIFSGQGLIDPNTGVLNPDRVATAAQIKPGMIRFPGGLLADYYHWQDGIGPPAARPIRPLMMPGGPESDNLFGTDELMVVSRAAGAQPLIQVNINTGTKEEAADWVRYCNAAFDARRQANGSTAPYAIRYWEIGNEQYADPGLGSHPESALSVDEYISRYLAFAAQMKSVDPTIKIGGIGASSVPVLNAFTPDKTWNQKLLQGAGSMLDFLSVHNSYAPLVFDPAPLAFNDVYQAMFAYPVLVERDFAALNQQIAQYAPLYADKIELAVTEWGPLFQLTSDGPYVDHAKTLGSAIYVANMLQVFARTPRVTMAHFFKLADWFFLGLSSFEGHAKPSQHVMEFFAKSFGPSVLPTTVASPLFNSKAVGVVDALVDVPYLDAVSSLDNTNQVMTILVVNKHFNTPIKTTIFLRGFTPQTTAQRWVLTAPSLDANNGNDLLNGTWAPQMVAPTGPMFYSGSPEMVKPAVSDFSVSGGTYLVYNFLPRSVTAITLHRAP